MIVDTIIIIMHIQNQLKFTNLGQHTLNSTTLDGIYLIALAETTHKKIGSEVRRYNTLFEILL